MEGETVSVRISQGDAQCVIELGGSIHVSEFLPRLRSNAVFKDAFLLRISDEWDVVVQIWGISMALHELMAERPMLFHSSAA
eukprot:scaffold12862_cov116-Isochrysis_galbana.AAC.4